MEFRSSPRRSIYRDCEKLHWSAFYVLEHDSRCVDSPARKTPTSKPHLRRFQIYVASTCRKAPEQADSKIGSRSRSLRRRRGDGPTSRGALALVPTTLLASWHPTMEHPKLISHLVVSFQRIRESSRFRLDKTQSQFHLGWFSLTCFTQCRLLETLMSTQKLRVQPDVFLVAVRGRQSPLDGPCQPARSH